MKTRRVYKPGAPATFVCPYCLGEHQVEKIWFRLPPSGSPRFLEADILNISSLAIMLNSRNRNFDKWIFNNLQAGTCAALANYKGDASDALTLKQALVSDFNRLISNRSTIYEPQRFDGITLRPLTKLLISQNQQVSDVECVNRLLVEDAYPLEVAKGLSAGQMLTGTRSWWQRRIRGPVEPPPLNGHTWEKHCPGISCGRVLPKSTGLEESLVIGLVGAQVSGKSHYITTLIERLGAEVGDRFEVGVMSADAATNRRFAYEFKTPLYDQKSVLDATIGSPPPLIYNLLFNPSRGQTASRSVTLALYDTAGENFRDSDKVRMMAAYLRVAAGVVFIVDPLQSKPIREMVGPNVALPDVNQDNLPENLIRSLTELLDNQGIAKGHHFQTPVAVTLSKADVLRDAGLIGKGDLWNQPEFHEEYFDDALHHEIEASVRKIFRESEPNAYNNIRTRFKRYAFFGVSATGCSPDPLTRRYPYIRPWRVEDPLLWLLAEIGVLPRRRGKRGRS